MELLYKVKEFASENRIAVECDGSTVSYKELDLNSEAIAYYLLNDDSKEKNPIVIYGNKDNIILSLMLGALKSGRAYIPLDITFPVERVKNVIDEVNAKVVVNLTDEIFEGLDILTKNDVVSIIEDNMDKYVDEINWVKDDENSYILFTSGSTGKPKGVQISKNNLDSFNKWFGEYLNFDNSHDVVLNQVSYSFDVSVIPIYIGLIHGKKLFSLSKKTLEDFKSLFEAFRISDLKTWVSTPALAELCVKDESFNKQLLPTLDTFFFAGEVLSKKLVQELFNRFPGVRIINGYGPTEATVLITAIDVTEEMIQEERGIPIGYPMDDAILKVVNEKGESVRDGEKGELIAIGKSISKGYFNNKELTDKVFFNEIIDGIEWKGYKTGDLSYYENGILHYCGRKDFQIKLNGFRIELEDIENNIRRVENVKNCIVLPVIKEEKISHLIAFVTLEEENDLSSLKNSIIIKNNLKKYIPSYMIPRNMKIIKEFPINTNGKIDRKKLMEEV